MSDRMSKLGRADKEAKFKKRFTEEDAAEGGLINDRSGAVTDRMRRERQKRDQRRSSSISENLRRNP